MKRRTLTEKILIWISVMLVSLLMLVGCGDTDNVSVSGAMESEEAGTQEPAASEPAAWAAAPMISQTVWQETVLPAGSRLRIVGTDMKGILRYELEGSSEEGEIHFERGTGGWQVYIGGVSEMEYFEDLPYAG